MRTKDYVPTTKAAFRSWVNSVYTLVNANAALWNIPAVLLAQFATMLAQFELLFATVDNERMRTTEQVIAFDTYRAEFTAFMRNLVQVHLVRNPDIPYATKIAMNLNVRTDQADRPNIESTPIIALSGANRGVIRIRLMVTDMGKRAKIHPDANGAELRFYLTAPSVPVLPASPDQGTGSRTLGDSAEPTPVQPVPPPVQGTVMETFVTTRGSFDRTMQQYIGREFRVQARWINSTDASKNGTWSDFFGIVIA